MMMPPSRLSALLFLLLLAPLLSPQRLLAAEPVQVAIGSVHQPLYDIAFDGARGIAVGAAGRVLVSADSGQSWQPEASIAKAGLLGVVMRGGHSIAVGQAGLVMVRSGEGAWRTVKVDSSERLMGIDMNSKGLAVVVGSFGAILKSSDYGETWSKSAADWPAIFAVNLDTLGPNFAPHLYGVNVSESGDVRIVGELALILASSGSPDTGSTKDWRVVSHGQIVGGQADPSLFAVRIREDGVGFATGQSGRALKTRDGGNTWTPFDAGTKAILLAIESTPAGRVLLTGIRELLESRDDGAHWQRIATPEVVNDWYVATAMPDSGGGVFAVGSSGKILKIPN